MRWREANPEADLSDTPTWVEPARCRFTEIAVQGSTEYEVVTTLLPKVARVSSVTIKHGKVDEVTLLSHWRSSLSLLLFSLTALLSLSHCCAPLSLLLFSLMTDVI